MTDEQINQRIAEACGWTKVKKFDWLFGIPPHNAGVFCRVHNYAGCLNAMHGAENQMGLADLKSYCEMLCDWMEADWGRASAPIRAKAFLKTIGKWEGEA